MVALEAAETISTAANSGINWIDWLPVILSACTLLFNVLFYFYFKDYLAFKYTRTADLAKISAEFLVYLTKAVSFDDFDGVPTQIKNYSEQILLCFKSGEKRVSIVLEKLFVEAQRRKQLKQVDEIQAWRDNFRLLTSKLQQELRKHCGVIK